MVPHGNRCNHAIRSVISRSVFFFFLCVCRCFCVVHGNAAVEHRVVTATHLLAQVGSDTRRGAEVRGMCLKGGDAHVRLREHGCERRYTHGLHACMCVYALRSSPNLIYPQPLGWLFLCPYFLCCGAELLPFEASYRGPFLISLPHLSLSLSVNAYYRRHQHHYEPPQRFRSTALPHCAGERHRHTHTHPQPHTH